MSNVGTFVSNIDRLATVSPDVKIIVANDDNDRLQRRHATLSKRIDVLNLTGENIVVRDKRGVEYHIESSNRKLNLSNYIGVFIFEETSFTRDVKCVTNFMTSPNGKYDELEDRYNEIIKKVVEDIFDDRILNGMRPSRKDEIKVKYEIPLVALETAGGVYIDTCDLVVCLERTKFNFHHPDSSIGIKLRDSHDTTKNGLNFIVEMVDRFNRVGDKWININGLVTKVPKIHSALETRKDGIYVFVNNELVNMYSLDEGVEKLRLYDTRSAAVNYGDLKTIIESEREKELADLAHKAKVEAAQLSLEKNVRDDYFDERKFIRNTDESRRKHDYEMRSYDRKEASEVIKWLPTLITGVLSALVLVKSL